MFEIEYSGREGYILGGSLIYVQGRYILGRSARFWEGRTYLKEDSGR